MTCCATANGHVPDSGAVTASVGESLFTRAGSTEGMSRLDARTAPMAAATALLLIPLIGAGAIVHAASADEEFAIGERDQGWFLVETSSVAFRYSLDPFVIADYVEENGTLVEYLSPAEPRAYTVERDAGVIRFGDGVRGRAPQSGDGSVVSAYRTGAGGIGAVVTANWTAAFPHGTAVTPIAPEGEGAVGRYRVTPPDASDVVVSVKGDHSWWGTTLNFTREMHVRVR